MLGSSPLQSKPETQPILFTYLKTLPVINSRLCLSMLVIQSLLQT